MVATKKCNCCKQTLPLTSFNKRSDARDGHQHTCRECTARLCAKWAKANPERRRAAQKRYAKKHPQKRQAQNRITYLVTSGQMPPASKRRCVGCGKQAQEYHHFMGYAPRNRERVIPVCKACHAVADRN